MDVASVLLLCLLLARAKWYAVDSKIVIDRIRFSFNRFV